MRYGGEGRSRLLLIILIVTSLFLITLDLRGVKILDGLRSGTQNVLSPFQKAGSTVVSPFRDFFGDVTHLGRTRNEIEKLKADNARLRNQLLQRKSADAALEHALERMGRKNQLHTSILGRGFFGLGRFIGRGSRRSQLTQSDTHVRHAECRY